MASNVELKVSASEMPPYVTPCVFRATWTSNTKSSCRPGYAIDLLHLITGDVLWKLTQRFVPGEAGMINRSIVESISNSMTQLTPPVMFYSDERNKVVKYLQPGISGPKQGYLVHHDEDDITWAIFAPFTRPAWLLGVTAYIVTAVALCFARYRYQRDFKAHIVMYQMSFGQKNHAVWKSRSEKIIITVWSAVSKVMASFYCFYFVRAILPLSPAEVAQRFSSIDKVAVKLEEGYKLVLINDNQFKVDFMNNPDEKIRELLGRNYRLSSINEQHISIEGLVNYTLRNRKTIMAFGDVSIAIYYRNLFQSQRGETRNVHAIADCREAFPRYVITSRELSDNISLRFEQRIRIIQQFGLAERLARMYKMDDVTKQQELSFKNHPNTLTEAISMYVAIKSAYVWLFGIATALISFVVEFITPGIWRRANNNS